MYVLLGWGGYVRYVTRARTCVFDSSVGPLGLSWYYIYIYIHNYIYIYITDQQDDFWKQQHTQVAEPQNTMCWTAEEHTLKWVWRCSQSPAAQSNSRDGRKEPVLRT